MLDDILPVVASLAAAFLFAVGAQLQNLGLGHIDSRAGALISIGTSALSYWLLSPLFVDFANFLHPAVLILVLIGLFRPALSANLALAGMRHLGPTLASTLASTSPLFGALFGVLCLGEALTWPIATGSLAIMAAVMLLARRGEGRRDTDWPLWALALPVGAAALRSAAHVLAKVGMLFIPSPYFVGLVGFSVSALVTLALHRGRRTPRPIRWRTRGPYWFVASGLTLAVAAMCMNSALQLGRIIVVVPIVAASPIFSLLLSLLIFRQERLGRRIVAAVLLVVPAVVLIALGR